MLIDTGRYHAPVLLRLAFDHLRDHNRFRIILADIIDSIQKNNPALSIYVYGQDHGDIEGIIEENFLKANYDIMLLGLTADMLTKITDFLPTVKRQMKILFHDKYYIVMGKSHYLAARESLTLNDLAADRLVLHSGSKTPLECRSFLQNHLVKSQAIYLESNVDILTYLKKGTAVSFFPEMFLRYEEGVQKGELLVKPLDDYYFAIEHCLVYPAEEQFSDIKKQIVMAIQQKYKSLQDKFIREPLY